METSPWLLLSDLPSDTTDKGTYLRLFEYVIRFYSVQLTKIYHTSLPPIFFPDFVAYVIRAVSNASSCISFFFISKA